MLQGSCAGAPQRPPARRVAAPLVTGHPSWRTGCKRSGCERLDCENPVVSQSKLPLSWCPQCLFSVGDKLDGPRTGRAGCIVDHLDHGSEATREAPTLKMQAAGPSAAQVRQNREITNGAETSTQDFSFVTAAVHGVGGVCRSLHYTGCSDPSNGTCACAVVKR